MRAGWAWWRDHFWWDGEFPEVTGLYRGRDRVGLCRHIGTNRGWMGMKAVATTTPGPADAVPDDVM